MISINYKMNVLAILIVITCQHCHILFYIQNNCISDNIKYVYECNN